MADIAQVLKLNEQTVRDWIDQGTLRAFRVGRRVRVRWGDVLALLEPAGPATRGERQIMPSESAQGFWNGDYVSLAGPGATAS